MFSFSTRAGDARPVRIRLRSSCVTAAAFFILSSADRRAVCISGVDTLPPFIPVVRRLVRSRLTTEPWLCLVDDRTDPLALHDPLDVALVEQVEDVDRNAVVLAQRNSRRVHHLEVALEHLHIGAVGEK